VTERGLCLTGRVWSVLSVCARLGLLIGHVRSLWELIRLKPDAGTVASGSSSSASGH
jgi:hypothetical protein